MTTAINQAPAMPESARISHTDPAAGAEIGGFWDESDAPTLDTEVAIILACPSMVTQEQWKQLREAAHRHLEGVDHAAAPEGYGANFDFTTEINYQLRAVSAMRRKIMDPDTGEILDGVPIREVKECLGAANTLTTALLKNHEKIINFERMRAIEQATIEAVQLLDPAVRKVFMAELNTRLERID
jgi:hypothetical protein